MAIIPVRTAPLNSQAGRALSLRDVYGLPPESREEQQIREALAAMRAWHESTLLKLPIKPLKRRPPAHVLGKPIRAVRRNGYTQFEVVLTPSDPFNGGS